MISYIDSVEGVSPAQLRGFFTDWGWPNPPSPETHLDILRRSDHVVLAMDTEEQRVAGYINALSDGVLTAYIPLLEVLKPYQGRGIGTELVRRMMGQLESLYMVDLTTEPALEPFYRRFGMQRAFGMVIRRIERQSGASR
jgi:ribosomal protein S18 acetylase RimI-like enzyme